MSPLPSAEAPMNPFDLTGPEFLALYAGVVEWQATPGEYQLLMGR